jgi:hypothetical protein
MPNFVTPDFWERRKDESALAHQFRTGQFAQHREGAQDDAARAHQEFRRAQETRTSGTGYGLAGDISPQQRAAVVGRGLGGSQRVVSNGHITAPAVPGSVAISRVYVGQLGEAEPGVSPLLRHLRGPVEEQWS